MRKAYSECLVKFGEKSNTESEDFFGPIATFLRRFSDSQKKVQASKDLFVKDLKKMRQSCATTLSFAGPGGAMDANGNLPMAAAPALPSTAEGAEVEIGRPSAVVHLASGNKLVGGGGGGGGGGGAEAPTFTKSLSVSSMDTAEGYINVVGGGDPTLTGAKVADTSPRHGGNAGRSPAATPSPAGVGAVAQATGTEAAAASPIAFVGAARGPPTRAEYLKKKSGGKSRAVKWDKRWCELSDTGYIHYYKKQGGKNAGSVFLKGAPSKVDPEDPTTFLVETVERTFSFRAPTAADCTAWLRDVRYYTEDSLA